MAVLLLAEINGSQLAADLTAKTLAAARDLGEVTILCAGEGCEGAAADAAGLEGVSKVLLADSPEFGHGLAEPTADLIVGLACDYEHIVGPASTSAQNILPRAAALLDAMVISDITAVIDRDTFERPIYAGNAIQTVKSADAKKFITIRTAAYSAAGTGGSASVERIDPSSDAGGSK
ncbi:MAG: electron transfer flavoprotein subunit alpha/FixB family protein, partial [Albidovulum sp.]|nr:electron transfer flavoprotein subunit alpha/FixB family protein [Albidovulum sp.]